VIEILNKLRARLEENKAENVYMLNVDWCIEIISKNKLYDPIIA